MKRIRNLTIILLSFIVMLCLAVGIVLCFPAQESSARAADAPRADTKTVTALPTINGGNLSNVELGNAENVALKVVGSVEIPARVFADNTQLYSVDLSGATITLFEEGAFAGCTNLRMVLFPATLPDNAIPANTFTGCTNLIDVSMPDSVTTIGASAFQNSGIVQITLPKKLSVPTTTFFTGVWGSREERNDGKPDSISLDSEVEAFSPVGNIGANAFEGCSRLVEVYNRSEVRIDVLDIVFGIANVTWSAQDITGAGKQAQVITSRVLVTDATTKVLNIWSENTSTYATKQPNDGSITGITVRRDFYYDGKMHHGYSNKSFLFRTDNGLVYCQNTMYNGDKSLAGDIKYVLNNWYLGAYIGDDRNEMLELPNDLTLKTEQWELNGIKYDYLVAGDSTFNHVFSDGSFDRNSGRTMSVSSNYGICPNVFKGIKIPYVNMAGRAVNAIGSGAFDCFGLQSIVLGENIMAIAEGSINTDVQGKLFVYLATPETAIEGAVPANCPATTYFIFENKTAYDIHFPDGATNTGKVIYTYKIPVNFFVNGLQIGNAGVEILKELPYSYRLDEDTYVWKEDGSATLPNLDAPVFGTSASPWYEETEWFDNGVYSGTSINSKTTVERSLESKLVGDEVNLYARRVEKLNASGYTTGYDGEDHGVVDTDTTDVPPDYAQTINYTDRSGKVFTDYKDGVINAGKYEITVGINPAYGKVYDGFNTEVVVNIIPRSIALSEFEWQYTTPTITTPQPLLSSGRQPIYLTIVDGNITGASLSSPENLPDGAKVEIVERRNSYVSVSASSEDYTLSVKRTFDESVLTVTETEDNPGNSGQGSGKYTAQAVINLVNKNNYTLEFLQSNTELGIRFEPQTDGSVIIYKEWYIVEAANLFMNGTVAFFIEERTFGEGAQINNPTMQYGAPQITFTLVMTNSEGRKQIAAKTLGDGDEGNLYYYINSSMPVGNYELTLSAEQATVGDKVYSANTTTFSFTVANGNLGEIIHNGKTVNAIVNQLNGKVYSSAYIAGSAFKYDTGEPEIVELENLLDDASFNNRQGEWTKPDYDGYYGKIELRYEIDPRMNSYAQTYEGFTNLVNGSVYYQLYAKNFGYLFSASTETEREAHSFKVIVYGVVDIPVINAGYNWIDSGIEVKPIIQNTGYYTIEWRDSDYTQADDENTSHQAVLILSDPSLYRWNANAVPSYAQLSGINNEVLTLTYKIDKVQNSWLVAPAVSDWVKGIDISSYYLRAVPAYTDSSEGSPSITYAVADSEGAIVYSFEIEYVNGIVSFATEVTDTVTDQTKTIAELFGGLGYGTYTLTATLSSSDNIRDIPEAACRTQFKVNKGNNAFSVTPSLPSWVFGEAIPALSAIPEHPSAGIVLTITFRDVNYTLSFNEVGNVEKFASIDLNDIKNGENSLKSELERLTSGNYSIVVAYGETDNYYGVNTTVNFGVIAASNGWVTFPNVTSWENGRYSDDVFTAGLAQHGEVLYTLDGSPCANVAEQLATLTVGSHVLTAGVPQVNGQFEGLSERKINFVVWNMVTGNSSGSTGGTTVSNAISQTFSPDAKFAIDDLEVKGLPAGAKIVYTVTKVGGDIQTPVARAVIPEEGTYEYCEYLINYNGIGTYIVTVTATATVENTEVSVQKNISIMITPAADEWVSLFSEYTAVYNDSGSLDGLTGFAARSARENVVYTLNGNTYTLSSLKNAIVALGAGNYSVMVSIAADNYEALSGGFALTVNPAANRIVSISVGNEYTYGAEINPTATATHGGTSFVFAYDVKNGNSWQSVNAPVNVGEYRVKATVAAFGNYAETTSDFTAQFSIIRANATISNLTMGNFQWNGYDRTTFAPATTNSPSPVSYAVYSGTIKLFDLGFDVNGLPDGDSVAAMNNLVAGSYRLVASTEVSTNFNATSTGADTGNFTVTAASNGWLVTPGIRSWVHYLFDDEVNMPYAAPQYGNITVEIRRESDKELIYSGTMTVTVGSDGEYTYAHTGNTAKLWNAVGGVYVLTVTVSGEAGKYNGLTSTARFDIFTGSTSRPQNYWEEVPSIDSWTSEYQDYTTPAGVPNRWTKVTHEYYEAERTQDGFISGDTVLATITRTYVGAGSPDKFEVDGTMPQKPGWYKVVYTSEYEDGETVYEADALTYTVYFQILEAENSWIETPSIENWLLNGEASVPTTGSAMYDSDYEITYRPFDDPDATPVEEKPTTAGRYVMIVTAKAKVEGKRSLYCKDIVSEVVFTVSLAVNEWITPPVMENWSEEFSDQEHNPVAEAKAGTVTYYYYDSNHELLKEKPTAAGDYFMVAEVEAEGYEKLSAEVKFTITSAWDESLILVDIVLGIAACAATVVAIIFAKRRKSQC